MEKRFIRMICGDLAEPVEDTFRQFKAISLRPVSHDKIFIRIILVKLHSLDSDIVLFSHYGISQLFCSKSFAYAWSSLEY